MAISKEKTLLFSQLIGDVLSEFGEFVVLDQSGFDDGAGVVVQSSDKQTEFRFAVTSRDRITPQMADDLFTRLNETKIPKDVTRVVLAPVISDRVAEIAKKHGISYLDHAGNCLIKNDRRGLFILRTGKKNDRKTDTPIVDIFSPKSSRIVRAMLSEPSRGWKITELAEHPDVDVSVGLAHKVKKSLIRESYAEERDRLLVLKQPRELLDAWSAEFQGSSSERKFYVRGDLNETEEKISTWCHDSNHRYSLARLSAAWRLAPEVRHNVASIYVDANLFTPSSLESLRSECGAKEVDSGANLILLTPYDTSVFTGSTGAPTHTSAIQTWLDLKTLSGRGEEAADAVYEKHIQDSFLTVNNDEGR